MAQSLYPLLFEPNLHSVVWGGKRICPYKGIPEKDEPIGESWEISAIPSSTSIISNGFYKGKKLTDIIEQMPAEILGNAVAENTATKCLCS